MVRNGSNKPNAIAWFLAGVIGGMTLAYFIKSIVDFNKRESHAWERAWEDSSYPLTMKLKKDRPNGENGKSSDVDTDVESTES